MKRRIRTVFTIIGIGGLLIIIGILMGGNVKRPSTTMVISMRDGVWTRRN